MIFTRDLTHAVRYADLSPADRFAHNVRLTVSTWDDAKQRFSGRDRREINATNDDGRHIGNLFEMGTALVASDNGAVFGSVTARSANRAAAAMALRTMRNGLIISRWTVEKINKSGESHSETFFFGADAPNGGHDDGDDGADRSEITTITLTLAEIALFDTIGIDDDDIDGYQRQNWADRQADKPAAGRLVGRGV